MRFGPCQYVYKTKRVERETNKKKNNKKHVTNLITRWCVVHFYLLSKQVLKLGAQEKMRSETYETGIRIDSRSDIFQL